MLERSIFHQEQDTTRELALRSRDSTLAVRERSESPTMGKHRMMIDDRTAKVEMTKMGLHVFDPSWNQYHSGSFRVCTLKIFGSTEELTIPVQTCTKVADVKNTVAGQCMTDPDKLVFIAKQGCSWLKLKDSDEIRSKVTVKGILSFKPVPKKWPHPIIFIGAGYTGIKHAILYLHYDQTDIIMFDRYDAVGGHAWLKQANKTSRLQTDLAAFHCWFGMEWAEGPQLGYPSDWSTWPKRDEVVAHMQHCAERTGLTTYLQLEKEIETCQVVGRLTDLDRYYHYTVQDLKDKHKPAQSLNASIVYHFPGAYFLPRNIIYPGEEDFGGKIGFGMGDDMPYEYLAHNQVAILGNGAFAVENIRTCVEYAASKVFLITRRKNLACPRMACWFVHQGIFPTPAGMLLRMYAPMYELGNFGDPWDFWSVGGNKATDKCVISSASRFGIGDVTFLCTATGRCEFIVDTVKRISPGTLHLNGGGKVENLTVIVKALGLLADFSADKMHSIKKTIGLFPDGDHRRIVTCDPLGMHAANFTTMSAGIGIYGFAKMCKVFVDFPQLWLNVKQEIGDLLPVVVAEENKPCYQIHAMHSQTCSMMIQGVTPMISQVQIGVDDYMHTCVWKCCPLDKVMAECQNAWDAYQEEFAAQGYGHPYIPYPYTMDTIKSWMEEYERRVGPLNVETKDHWMENKMSQGKGVGNGASSKYPQHENNAAHMDWWRKNCSDTKYKMPGETSHGFQASSGG